MNTSKARFIGRCPVAQRFIAGRREPSPLAFSPKCPPLNPRRGGEGDAEFTFPPVPTLFVLFGHYSCSHSRCPNHGSGPNWRKDWGRWNQSPIVPHQRFSILLKFDAEKRESIVSHGANLQSNPLPNLPKFSHGELLLLGSFNYRKSTCRLG